MFDINFYMKLDSMLSNKRKISYSALEALRDKYPFIYNIETTNACNMRCQMCPRTTMMNRLVETMKPDLFYKIIDQVPPHNFNDWLAWEIFCNRRYGIGSAEMSENHFFLYIIPKVIQLHGYGDPLLDKNMPFYIEYMHRKGLFSYFSCNPANINVDQTLGMFSCGLDYIKYSIESVNDDDHKVIRGKNSNFTQSYEDIKSLLYFKKKYGYHTTIIITMLNLNRVSQTEDFEKLKQAFAGEDVYIYLKSEDQLWYRQEYHKTDSIHWSEPCKHPWMSMTIKSDGKAAMCMEDFNNEIILGDANTESLYNIWNGRQYDNFRRDHISTKPCVIKCYQACDMVKIGEII